MTLDPAADPWGLVLLAAAALWVLSCLLLLAALAARTSPRRGLRMVGGSSLVFLGTSIGGTWHQIDAAATVEGRAATPPGADSTPAGADFTRPGAEPARAAEPASAEPASAEPAGSSTVADPGASDEPSVADLLEASNASSRAPSAMSPESNSTLDADPHADPHIDPDPGSHAGPHAVMAGQPGEPEAPAEAVSPAEAVIDAETPTAEAPTAEAPTAAALPSDPKERRWAIALIMRESEEISGNPRTCARLDEVAKAWAGLKQVPSSRRSRYLARELDKCRRKLLYSISRRHRRAQVDARDAFAERLADELRQRHSEAHWVSVSGTSHERIRIGAGSLDAARADVLMRGELGRDLERLAFARVTLSNGKASKVYEFDVTPDRELGLPDLRAVGLGEPLELSED